jgi:hypothetical protein
VCPVPEVPPSEGVPEDKEKNCSCTDIDRRISNVEEVLKIDDNTLANKSYGATIDKINNDVLDLYNWINDIYKWMEVAFDDIEGLKNKTEGFSDHEDLMKKMRNDIKEKGLWLGRRWWVGQQNENLYAIDAESSSFYTFEAGVNVTLSGK